MSNQPFDAANKIIVVTGGASGIGAAMCRAFAKARASAIVVADVNITMAEQICKECCSCSPTSSFSRFTSRYVDVANDGDIGNLITWTESNVGPIDLFICNAGVMPSKNNLEVTGATSK